MAPEPYLEYIITAISYEGDENMDNYQKCALFTIITGEKKQVDKTVTTDLF